VVWATYLGGAGDDAGQAIAVDAAGDVYIAGITAPGIGVSTNNFPTSTGSAFPASATSGDGFVVKLNAAGSQMMFGTYLPGIGTYVGYGYGRGDTVAMAIDPSGSVYVAGSIAPASFNFPTTAGAFQTSSNAQETGVVVKLNVAGALVYATYLGENSMGATTRVSAIAVDASGSAYLTGMAPDQFPTTAGAYEDISDGGPFVTKLNVAGSGEIYSTFVGGGNAGGLAIKLDSQGRAYVLGQVYCSPMCMINPTGFTTPGAFEPGGAQPPWAQPSAVAQFLVSLSADGSSLVYGTYITGALVLDVDASGDAFVAGYSGGGFPVTILRRSSVRRAR
jgi:hypothetical protein